VAFRTSSISDCKAVPGTANAIPTLKSALDKAGTRYGLDVFPNSRHGFQFPERDVYETHAAEESWSKVVAMRDRNLK
jgi:carboxymethylenebutenolidase